MASLEKIKERWEYCATSYSSIIKDELNSFRPKAWIDLISEQIDTKEKLNILDIGCGPGFFSIILSKQGHNVIGIDCSGNMIEEAKFNAKNKNTSPKFMQMDSHKLDFEDNTFDLILNRNVTWTLAEPIKAYTEWKRVLKPNGKLLIFDANWHLDKYDEELRLENQKRLKKCLEKYGSTFGDTYDGTEEKIKAKLPLEDKLRPRWDEIALSKIGFKNLKIEENIIDRVWDDKEKLLYGATPMFMISCEKTINDKPKSFAEVSKSIQEYWTKRSSTYSDGNNKELQSNKKEIWTDMILENVPRDGKLKILDIGCGPGEFSILMAKAGHDVIGVDLTKSMLNEAKSNAEKYGVYPKFVQMDVQNLEFEDQTFDMVISRNVTWNIQDIKKFFEGCSRVLKKDGRLVYFDANWYLYLYDDEERIKKELADKKYREIYKKDRVKSTSNVSLTNVAYSLPMSKVNRPTWDEDNLYNYNLEVIKVDRNINEKLLNKEEMELEYTPMFAVVAKKLIEK